MKKILIVIACMYASNSINATELTTEEKSKLYQNLINACFEVQRSNEVNEHLQDQTIFQYCACTSDLVSSTLSKEDVENVEKRGDYHALRFVQSNAEKYCTEKIFK